MFNIFKKAKVNYKEFPEKYVDLGKGLEWFSDYHKKGRPTLTKYFALDVSKKKEIQGKIYKVGLYKLENKEYFALIVKYLEYAKEYVFYLPGFEYDPYDEYKQDDEVEVIVEEGDYSKYDIPIY